MNTELDDLRYAMKWMARLIYCRQQKQECGSPYLHTYWHAQEMIAHNECMRNQHSRDAIASIAVPDERAWVFENRPGAAPQKLQQVIRQGELHPDRIQAQHGGGRDIESGTHYWNVSSRTWQPIEDKLFGDFKQYSEAVQEWTSRWSGFPPKFPRNLDAK